MSSAAAAEWRVRVGDDEVTARFEPPPGGQQRAVFVCGHGAGGNMADRGMQGVAAALRSAGLGVVRFNFLYSEKRLGRPDPMPRLRECIAAVVERVRSELTPRSLIIGGRSMGGRAASMMAADGFVCDGLILLAYPLHPAGKTDTLRDAHLPAIAVPVLCVNGTRDTLCRHDIMEGVLQRVKAPWMMHWIEGADHGFHVLKSSGLTDEQVLQEVGAVARDWLDRLSLRE